MTKVAIDAMGGDFGAEPIVKGVLEALKEREFHAYLVGDENEIKSQLVGDSNKNITIIHADDVFDMSQSATNVLKRKNSSIYKAVELVKSGECQGVVSAGHSGATMSLATLVVGRLKNVSRPPIATLMPNSKPGKTLVLDVGANVDCKQIGRAHV